MNSFNVVAVAGSLREKSMNAMLANSLSALAPEGMTIDVVSLADVPLFNQDQEQAFPDGAHAFKERIRNADGVIIVTPEYNRSIPGVLKNAIDWASRPYTDNAWTKKPILVMGASGGATGTAVAQYDVKKVMLFSGAHVMGQPELFIGGAVQKFDESGALTDEDTRTHLQKALAAFASYIGLVSATQ
jgi:NAD(P)H-dependent FMN reductase